jgi:glycosyltransferase involved in cell wall biosynthesis
LCLVPNVALTVVGYGTNGHPGYFEYFKNQVVCRGLSSRVISHGVVSPREELLKLCLEQNLGLALVPMCTDEPNLAAMAGASNKIFDYLASGLPILVSDLPDHRRLFVDAGVAKVCDPRDPESIASAFRWFLNHEGEAHQMGMKGKEKVIREWNYEYQFQPVLGLLSASTEGLRRRPMLQSSNFNVRFHR